MTTEEICKNIMLTEGIVEADNIIASHEFNKAQFENTQRDGEQGTSGRSIYQKNMTYQEFLLLKILNKLYDGR
jgi:hypothetical protein